MKPYILEFKKSDLDGNFRTAVIDLYDNNQYKNYSVKRSNYGSDLLETGVYTGTNRVSATQSEIGYVTSMATPAIKRFIDTTSRIDIIAWELDLTALGNATGEPIPTINVYHTDTPTTAPAFGTTPADWAYQSDIREVDDIYIINAGRYAFFELEFDGSVASFDFTLRILLEIDPPTVDAFFTRTGALLDKFPHWTALNEYDPVDPNYINAATPTSVGGKFLNAVAGEWITDLASQIDYQQAQWYLDTVDLEQKSWIWQAIEVPRVVKSIKGHGVELARASDLEEFYSALTDDYVSYWNRSNNEVYTIRRYGEYMDSDWIKESPFVYYHAASEPGALTHDTAIGRAVADKASLTEVWDYWFSAAQNRIYVYSKSTAGEDKAPNDIARSLFYSTFTINGVPVSQHPYHVWNSIDDLGATVDLWRIKLESNSRFLERIKDVYKNRPGTSVEAFQKAIRRELDMWRLEGATPSSDYTGATPDVFEISDLEKNPEYFTDRGLPTRKFKLLIEDIAKRFPIAWGYFNFYEAYWDPDGLRHEGVAFTPRMLDATPVSEEYSDSGVGDGNDLFLFRPDVNKSTVQFNTSLKVRGRQRTTRQEYGPLLFDVLVYGQADRDIYTNPPFTGQFTLELTLDEATPRTVYTVLNVTTISDVDYDTATPTSSSRSYLTWNTPSGRTSAEYSFYNKANGTIFFSDMATPNSRIDLDDIQSVTIKPGRWDYNSQTYVNVPTASQYKLWFTHLPSTWMGLSGASQVTIANYDWTIAIGSIYVESQRTAHTVVADGFSTAKHLYTIRINDANPPTTTKDYVLSLPNLYFPSDTTNREIIVELLTSSDGGTTFGAMGDPNAATPIFVPASLIRVNGDGTWTSGKRKSLPTSTTVLTFSSGTNANYPYTVPVWTTYEANLITPITGTVDQNGPWRDGEPLPESNTNYRLTTMVNLTRNNFGIPNTTDYILSWIGIGSTSSPDVITWIDSNTIIPAVVYGGESQLDTPASNGAIAETLVGGTYTFSPVPVYAKLRPGTNEKWNPTVHSGWLYDSSDEYYLYANPKTHILPRDVNSGYAALPGTVNNTMTVADAVVAQATPNTNMTIVVRVAQDDWTPTTVTTLASQWNTSTNQRSWRLDLLTTGGLSFFWSANGIAFSSVSSTVTTLSALLNGTPKWIAVTFIGDNGSGSSDTRFWISDDGNSWDPYGAVRNTAGVSTIYDGNATIRMSGIGGFAQEVKGKYYHFSLRTGTGPSGTVGGSEIFKFDGTEVFARNDTTFKSASGHTVSVVSSADGATPGAYLVPLNTTYEIDAVNRQGAPVILYGLTGATPVQDYTLRQVSSFFMDDRATPATPSLTLYQSEKMKGNNTNKFFLSYGNVYDIVVRNTTLDLAVPLVATSSADNQVTMTSASNEKYDYEITYRIRNSYFVDNGPDKMRVVLDKFNHDKYGFVYESSIYDPATPISVPLNMMYTSISEGFIYVDHDVHPLNQIELSVSPTKIIANGNDFGLVTVYAYDTHGNPKPNTTIQLYTNFGTLANSTLKTDDVGFAYTTLSAEVWDGVWNPSPATPVLAAPTLANGYRGTVLAVSGNKQGVFNFTIDIPAERPYRLFAAPVSDNVLANGASAASIQGKIEKPDHTPVPGARITWRKGRTIYDTLSKVPRVQPEFQFTFPGTNLNYLTTPDAGPLDILGDLTIVARVNLTDLLSNQRMIASKYASAAGARSWYFAKQGGANRLQFGWSSDGTNVNVASATADLPLGWTWVAVTFDADNGASGRTTRFWTSTDGINWTINGSVITQATVTSIFNSTAPLEVASFAGGGGNMTGQLSHFSLRNGIGAAGAVGGTEVFGFDGKNITSVANTTFTARTGQTVTVGRSGAVTTTITPVSTPAPGVSNKTGYVTADADGRFIVEPFVTHTEPGYWFVALESDGYAAATPAGFNLVGDIVSWYEFPNVNAASDPITNLARANVQDATPSWSVPNYTYGSTFPVTYDEEDYLDVANGATPQWLPPKWYAINRYRQYQMGLRGNQYYEVGATPAHPDYKEF